MRLSMEPDMEVVGEAGNGREAVRLARTLSPLAAVLDLEMPVMGGAEAIPLLREAAPGIGILLYTAAHQVALPDKHAPDSIVRKGGPLSELVSALRKILDRNPLDLVHLRLEPVTLRQAIAAFDAWTGLNLTVLSALERGHKLSELQLGGASRDELEALMGVYAHIGLDLQKAARLELDTIIPVIHIRRATAVLARKALLSLDNDRLPLFWEAWGYTVPREAAAALGAMRSDLLDVLPSGPAA